MSHVVLLGDSIFDNAAYVPGQPPVIEHFLTPRLKNLADPFLLPDMETAVTRLLLAHERAEPLVIFGDYDVDGVTSTTLLLEVTLKALVTAVERPLLVSSSV